MKKRENRLIVVLGPHRSGTSVITRGLQVMGVELGKKLMPPVEGNNDKGFWEDTDINSLNIEMLNSLNSDWHFLTPIQPSDVSALRRDGYVSRALELLKEKTFGIHTFGFKDPRVSKLLPLWKEVFVQSHLNVNYVITLRHPLSVCQSLAKRDGFDIEKGALLWLEHMISSLVGTVGENCIIVDYDRLMQWPETELKRLAKRLQLQIDFPELQKFKSEFIDKKLRHTAYQVNDSIFDEVMPPLARDVYTEALKVAMDDTQLETAYLKDKIARWNNEFSREKSALVLADKLTSKVISINQILAEKNQILDEKNRVLAEKERVLAEKEQTLHILTSQLTERVAQVQALTAQLYEITSSKAWQVAMMLRNIRVFLFPPGRMNPRLKRVLLLLPKTLDFYRKNGLRPTFLEIQNQLRFRNQKVYSYQYLVEKFPQQFGRLQSQSHHSGEWKAIVDSCAQVSLQNLLAQLSIKVDAGNVLLLVKDNFSQDQYLHILDNIFSLEQFVTGLNGSTAYPLVQTSSLPEVSNRKIKRRILFVTSQFPNPYNGGGNRVLNFIKILSEDHDVYLSTCFIPEDDEKALPAVARYCRSIQKIPLWRFGNNQVEIREWLKGVSMDVVHYEWPRSLENYDPAYGKYHIFTYMEAASLRLLMDIKNLELLSDPWLAKFIELIHTLRLELVETSRLSARIAVTTKDGEFFRALYPYQEYAVLNHGITFDEFSLPDIASEPNTLVFVGNYQHYPNVAAMEYFFREIWNDIIREVPDTRIYLVGPKPPKEIECRADGKQIFVIGGVADIRPYIQKASVCIAPLITGAGMRGKVIDYAALRRAFVATSIATTDLVFRDDIDYMRADTAQEFAQKTVILLRDRNKAKEMATAAYETARQNYDNRRLSNFLLRLYKYLEG